MSVKMIHSCDRCNEKYENDPTRANEFVPMRIVGIQVGPVWADRLSYHKPVVKYEQTWCLKCVQQFNLDGLILRADTVEKVRTLEDYIKEIVTHAMKEEAE